VTCTNQSSVLGVD